MVRESTGLPDKPMPFIGVLLWARQEAVPIHLNDAPWPNPNMSSVPQTPTVTR
jgi:hypothetical protein